MKKSYESECYLKKQPAKGNNVSGFYLGSHTLLPLFIFQTNLKNKSFRAIMIQLIMILEKFGCHVPFLVYILVYSLKFPTVTFTHFSFFFFFSVFINILEIPLISFFHSPPSPIISISSSLFKAQYLSRSVCVLVGLPFFRVSTSTRIHLPSSKCVH